MQNGRTIKANKTRPASSNLVIGLTGPFGSGCGEMRSALEGLGFKSFRVSAHIRDEVKSSGKLIEKGKADWRKALQDHGNTRRKEDLGYWAKKVAEEIEKSDVGDCDIAIDGLRNFSEVQEMRRMFPLFFLVAICAPKDERWKRVRNDYAQYREFERDDRRDSNEDVNWGQNVQKCVDDADYVFYNDQSLFVSPPGSGETPDSEKIQRTLRAEAKDFVALMKGDAMRPPRTEEVQIAAAYAHSNSSRCLKRHVGAVITVGRNGSEFPISMGYNENPPNIPTCSDEACYKDEDLISKLNAQGKHIYCPSCGSEHVGLQEPWICKSCGQSFREWLYPSRNMELCTAIHAEERAILSLGGRSAEGGTLYVTTFPCFQCARLILDAGIKRVVYVEAYPIKNTAEFLKAKNVDVQPFSGFTARAFFRVFRRVD